MTHPNALHSSIEFVHVTQSRIDIVTLDSPVNAEWYILRLLAVPVPAVISLV